MDRMTGLQLFVRVVETGSFSKAAAELGIAQPTVTKAVAAIEKRLGARLLYRSTRGAVVTEVGALYYERCKRLTQDFEEIENLAALRQSEVAGQLRISASVAFGRRVLVPLVVRYMQGHPQLTVDLSVDDRYVNLVEQGIDLAVRLGPLADSGLGARYLGSNPWLIVASPACLDAHGTPASADELESLPCLVYSSVQGDDRWPLTAPDGRLHSVPVRGPLRSNNLSALLAATIAGLGFAALPWYVANVALHEGRVRAVLGGWTLPSQEMHAVFPSPKLVPAKVNHFIAHLQRSLSSGDWWRSGP